MEKLKHARLFSTDQKIFVECNKEEMPVFSEHFREKQSIEYGEKYRAWLGNCKIVEVHPSEVKEFINLAFKHYYPNRINDCGFEEFLQQGIMLPPDSVRIEFVCGNFDLPVNEVTCVYKCNNSCKEYAFLSEESSETQEALLLSDLLSMLGVPNENIKESYKQQALEKFEIKRKQG